MLRIKGVTALDGFRLRLRLTDGSVIERDVSALLRGPVFEPITKDPSKFRQVRVEGGSFAWESGGDLCPDVLIWGGPPPEDVDSAVVPEDLALHA